MERKYEFYTILNWKSGSVHLRKTKPSKSELSPYEIAILNKKVVTVPETDFVVNEGKIEVSIAKLNDAKQLEHILEQINEPENKTDTMLHLSSEDYVIIGKDQWTYIERILWNHEFTIKNLRQEVQQLREKEVSRQ